VSPFGLSCALATLATYLVPDTPTETWRRVASYTASLILRPMVRGVPKMCSDPDMSRNASSSDSGSTAGEKSPNTSMTCREISS